MNKGVTSRGSVIGIRGGRGGGSVLSSSTCGTLVMLSIHQNTVLYISPYKLKLYLFGDWCGKKMGSYME